MVDGSGTVPELASGWRADIDGLRAVAVLSVVAYHALPMALPGGFVGVDVFFVISGYLITEILLKEHQTGQFSLTRFYQRRIRRLFPALALVLAFTVLASFLFSYPEYALQTTRLAVASAFSAGNIVLWRESGYFDAAAHLKSLLNLWSLGVEEQFYFVWPPLLTALVRSRWLTAIVFVGMVSSLAVTEWLNEAKHSAVFYLPFFRAWELAAGAFIAVLEQRGITSQRLLTRAWADRLTLTGLALIIGSTVLLDSTVPFPGLSAALPVLGTALAIWGTNRQAPSNSIAYRTLTSRPVVYIGLVSYSFYLWHWPLLSLPATAGIELHSGWRGLIVLLAFILSAATLKWIEAPARQSRRPVLAAWLSFVALLSVAALAAVLYGVEQHFASRSSSLSLASPLEWPSVQPDRKNCPKDLLSNKPAFRYCQASQPASPTAAVWGDSHADRLFSGLSTRDSSRNWLLLGHSSCPPVLGIDVIAGSIGCRDRSDAAARWLAAQPSIDTVVLGFFGFYFEDTDIAYDHRNGPVGPMETQIDGTDERTKKITRFSTGLRTAVERLLAAGKSIVIVIDVPELPFNLSLCFSSPRIRIAEPVCSVPRESVNERQASLRHLLDDIVRTYPSVRLVDPMGVLCETDYCGPGDSKAPTYHDSHHLSKYGGEKVADLILQALPSK